MLSYTSSQALTDPSVAWYLEFLRMEGYNHTSNSAKVSDYIKACPRKKTIIPYPQKCHNFFF